MFCEHIDIYSDNNFYSQKFRVSWGGAQNGWHVNNAKF